MTPGNIIWVKRNVFFRFWIFVGGIYPQLAAAARQRDQNKRVGSLKVGGGRIEPKIVDNQNAVAFGTACVNSRHLALPNLQLLLAARTPKLICGHMVIARKWKYPIVYFEALGNSNEMVRIQAHIRASEQSGPAAPGVRVVNELHGWSPSAPRKG
jgi:hypothetical protein